MKKRNSSVLVMSLSMAMNACVFSDAPEKRLSDLLVNACPPASADDVEARTRCSDALGENEELRAMMADPFYWGAQVAGSSVDRAIDDSSVTDFNPYVWRKIYLSVYTFDGPGTIEAAGKYTVLRMPVHFRNAMNSGEYPYPFWHSQKKWLSYEQSPEVLFYFKGGQLIGALRADRKDESRSHVDRMFDGMFTWQNGEEPHVTLFRSIFSANNPNLDRLESTYRSFAEGMRDQSCVTCHSPTNPAMMKHLELLIFPNQALGGRHDVVEQLKQNLMPPGIGIPDEAIRADLIVRAEAFAKAGDDALAFEGEITP